MRNSIRTKKDEKVRRQNGSIIIIINKVIINKVL